MQDKTYLLELEKLKETCFAPIYQQVTDFLWDKIRKGDIPHGTKLPSESVLAKKLGISRVTLRHALGILTKKGLLVSYRGKGSFVQLSETNRYTQNKTVGFISSYDLEKGEQNPFLMFLLQGVKNKLEGRVKLLLLSRKEGNLAELYHGNHLDAMLIISPSKKEIKDINKLPLQFIPHVIVSSSFNAYRKNKLVFVDSDNIEGACKAVNYLTSLGHMRIAYIGAVPQQSNSIDRLKGYKKALREKGIEFDTSLVYEDSDGHYLERAYDATKEILETRDPPTAIFAGGFELALRTIKAIRKTGLKIPDDISVIGFDDFGMCDYISPTLTTVKQPLYELGEKAAEKILEWINNGNVKQKMTILPTELIIRESCGRREGKHRKC